MSAPEESLDRSQGLLSACSCGDTAADFSVFRDTRLPLSLTSEIGTSEKEASSSPAVLRLLLKVDQHGAESFFPEIK